MQSDTKIQCMSHLNPCDFCTVGFLDRIQLAMCQPGSEYESLEDTEGFLKPNMEKCGA